MIERFPNKCLIGHTSQHIYVHTFNLSIDILKGTVDLFFRTGKVARNMGKLTLKWHLDHYCTLILKLHVYLHIYLCVCIFIY